MSRNGLFWFVMAAIGIAVLLLMFNDSAGSTLGVENYDFSRLVWLGLLALVIGGGLLRSGRPLGAMARNLGAWAIIVLALLHALAGLFHHYFLRDGVLRRMLSSR